MSDWEQRADDGDGHFAIACGLIAIAKAIDRLGNGNASTPMGAIEAFGMHIGEKIELLANALRANTDGYPE